MARLPASAGLLACALLAGCNTPTLTLGVAGGAVDATSVMMFQRSIADIFVSAGSGRDCSIVHLDRGQTYCRPLEPPPPAPAYCTRTLGTVDCWASPIIPANPARGLADGPSTLTEEQDANRLRPWPGLLSSLIY